MHRRWCPGAGRGRNARRRRPFTRSVSPVTRRMLSSGTPSHSVNDLGKRRLMSLALRHGADRPTSTAPSGLTVISAFSRGTPVAVST